MGRFPDMTTPLREKYPYSELFWSVFSRIRTEYGVSLRIPSEFRKIRTRITPNTDIFLAVLFNSLINMANIMAKN